MIRTMTKFVIQIKKNHFYYEVIVVDINIFFELVITKDVSADNDLKSMFEDWLAEEITAHLKVKGYDSSYGHFKVIGVLREPAIKIEVEGSLS